MPDYKLPSGQTASEVELIDFAKQNNLTLEEILEKNPDIEIIQDEQLDQQSFQEDPVAKTAVVGSENQPQAVDTESISVDTSLVSQDPDPKPKSKKFIEIGFDNDLGVDPFLFEDQYIDIVKNNPDKGLPSTFEDYAKLLKKEIREDVPDLGSIKAKPLEIKLNEQNKIDFTSLESDLRKRGFLIKEDDRTVDGVRRKQAVEARAGKELSLTDYTITAGNGQTFELNSNNLLNEEYINELNNFLNQNKSDYSATRFFGKNNYTNNDLDQISVDGVMQAPSYMLLNNIQNLAQNALEDYTGRPSITNNDNILKYSNLYTLAEDFQNVNREDIVDTVSEAILERITSNNPGKYNNSELFETIRTVVQKEGWVDKPMYDIKLKEQADQEQQLKNVTLTDDERQQWINSEVKRDAVNNQDNLRRYNLVKTIAQDREKLSRLQSLPPGVNTQEATAELNDLKIRIEKNQGLLEKLPTSYGDEGGAFVNEFGDQNISTEELQELLKEIKGSVLNKAEFDILTNGKTLYEQLGDNYDNMIKEYMSLSSWSRNTKLLIRKSELDNISLSLSKEKLEERLGRKNPEFITVEEYLKLAGDYSFLREIRLDELVGKDGAAQVDLYKKWKRSLDLSRSALNDLYLYNIDPGEIEKDRGRMLVISALEGFFPDAIDSDNPAGYKKLENISQFIQEYNDRNAPFIESGLATRIDLTKKQKEQLEVDLIDKTVQTGGGMISLVTEFGLLNAMTGGMYSLTGMARRISSLEKAIAAGSTSAKFQLYGIKAIEEGGKFVGFERLQKAKRGKTGSIQEDAKAFTTGVSFGVAGFVTPNMPKLLKPESKIRYYVGQGANAFGTTTGAVYLGSSLGEVAEGYVDSWMNDSDFQTFIKEQFGEDSKAWEDRLIGALSFGFLGIGKHSNKGKNWEQFKRESDKLEVDLNNLYLRRSALKSDLQNKEINLTSEQRANAEKTLEQFNLFIPLLEKELTARSVNLDFNVTNPNLQKNLSTSINKAVPNTQALKGGEGVKVVVVEDAIELESFGAPKGSEAWWDRKNTVYFSKRTANGDAANIRENLAHETPHIAIDKFLSNSSSAMPRFKSDMVDNLLKSFGGNGEELKKDIQERYGIDIKSEYGTQEFNNEIFAHLFEIMTSKKFNDNYLDDSVSQELWNKVRYSFNDIYRRVNKNFAAKEMSADEVIYNIQQIAYQTTNGKAGDATRDKLNRVLSTVLEGDLVTPQTGATAGQAKKSRQQLDNDYANQQDLLIQGIINNAEFDLITDKYIKDVEALDQPSTGKTYRENEVLIDIINNTNSRRVDISQAEEELFESSLMMAKSPKGLAYDSYKHISKEDFDLEIGLFYSRALENFDPSKGNKWSTYWLATIKNKWGDILKKYPIPDKPIEGQEYRIADETYTSDSFEVVSEKKGIKPVSLIPQQKIRQQTVQEVSTPGNYYDASGNIFVRDAKTNEIVYKKNKNGEFELDSNGNKIPEISGNISQLSFGTTPGFATNSLAEYFGVKPNKISNPKDNLTLEDTYYVKNSNGDFILDNNGNPKEFNRSNAEKQVDSNQGSFIVFGEQSELKTVGRRLQKLGDDFLKLFPEFNVAAVTKDGKISYEIPAEKDVIGRSLGLPGTVAKYMYEPYIDPVTGKQARAKNPKSQTPVQALKDLTPTQFYEIITSLENINYEKPEGMSSAEWLKQRRDLGQFYKGLMSWYDKTVTNEILRRSETLEAVGRANLEAGLPKGMAKISVNQDALKGIKDQLTGEEADIFAEKLEKLLSNKDIQSDDLVKGILQIGQDIFGTNSINNYKAWTRGALPFLQNVGKEREISSSDILNIVENYRKVYDVDLQPAAYNDMYKKLETSIGLYSDLYQQAGQEAIDPKSFEIQTGIKAETKEQQQEVITNIQADKINNFIRYYRRGSKNKRFDGVTTNKDYFDLKIVPLLENNPELAKRYNVITTNEGARSYIAFDGVIQHELLNIDVIKADPFGSQKQVAEEASNSIKEIKNTLTSLVENGRITEALGYISYISIDQRGPLRKTANLDWVEINLKSGESILEHKITVKEQAQALRDYVNNPSEATLKTAFDLLERSTVSIVSKEFDGLLKQAENNGYVGEQRYEYPPVKKLFEKLKSEGKIVYVNEPTGGLAKKSKTNSTTISASNTISEVFPKLPKEMGRAQSFKMGEQADAENFWNIGRIPYADQDFLGLLQYITPKGERGNEVLAEHRTLFTEPFNIASQNIDSDKMTVMSNYNNIKNANKVTQKELSTVIQDSYFRNEDAVRVYIWNKQGHEIPQITSKEKQNLLEYVKANPKLSRFADAMSQANGKFGFAEPQEYWLTGSIKSDLDFSMRTINRQAYLRTWQTNVDNYFTEGNLNRMEAGLGTKWRKALENNLYRQRTGKRRSYGADEAVYAFENAITGAVGVTMHLNVKSAVNQLASSTNFINLTDNNPLAAAKAFANQPQYWEDVRFLWNQPSLRLRRKGLTIDINDADIAEAAGGGGWKSFAYKMIKAGMSPMTLGDNIAITAGGATFYRNRLNTYKKQGIPEAEAISKSLNEWSEIYNKTQQSIRPDLLSSRQTGEFSRYVLSYTNTPQQYLREMNKAYNNIKNKRGSFKENASKILYYGSMQNLLFTTLQQGVTSYLFDPGEEELPEIMTDPEFQIYLGKLPPSKRKEALDKRKKELKEVKEIEAKNKKKTDGLLNTINGMSDTLLKGYGLYGQVAATIKNTGFRAYLESKKDKPNFAEQIPRDLLGVSPGASIKYNYIRKGLMSFQYNAKEMRERGLGDLENPVYEAAGNIFTGITNIPVNQYLSLMDRMRIAADDTYSTGTRVFSALGWSRYALGIERPEWVSTTPEQEEAFRKWKEEALGKLSPSQRYQFFEWEKERKKALKEKNKQ